MKVAWTILLITALTDFVITAGTALSTAMVATGSAEIPGTAALMFAGVGGLVVAARTVQQALKSTPTITAALTGVKP